MDHGDRRIKDFLAMATPRHHELTVLCQAQMSHFSFNEDYCRTRHVIFGGKKASSLKKSAAVGVKDTEVARELCALFACRNASRQIQVE
jgi:hypothetical protein